MPLTHEERFTVLMADCDPFGRMTPGAMLRHIQQISIDHCDEGALDLNRGLSAAGVVFLLSKTSLEIHTAPADRQRVRLETRAYGPKRAVYHRVTSMYGEDGALLAEADCRWVLVDIEARRILRRPPEGIELPFSDEAQEAHEMKLPKCDTGPLGEFCATYSQCDSNGHMNNTRYVDLVCDMLPLAALEKAPPRKIVIDHRAEVPLGARFALQGGAADGLWYFTAQGAEGARHFDAWVVL